MNVLTNPEHRQDTFEGNPALKGRQKAAWWTIFVVILIAGFVLAATGYKHGLPAIDFGDEVTIWTMGRAYLDPSWTIYQPQYPPGILVVSALVQQAQITLGDPYINVAVTVEVMRMMSIVAYVVMLALTMLLARRFAGPIAGIAAGLFLAPLPLATDLAKLSTNNLWTTAWLVAAVLAGIEGWSRRSLRWIAFSLVLAILGTLFKWQDAAALGISGLALLSLWSVNRRRIIILFAIYIVIVGVLSYWVIFVHHALEGDVYLPGIPSKPPTPDLILINFWAMTTQFAPVALYAVLPLLALILSFMPRFRTHFHRQMGLWTLPCVILAYTVVISFNGAPVFSRQYLPILPLFAVLGGIGVVLIFESLRTLSHRFNQQWLYPVLAGLSVLIIAIPIAQMTVQSYQAGLADLLPDRRAALIEWARTTIDAPMLVTDTQLAPILQVTYGYRGPLLEQPYNLDGSVQVKPEDIDQKVIDAQNIRYLVTNPGFTTSKIQVTQLLRYAPGNTRGNAWQVMYVGPLPEVLPKPATIFGNQVSLRGYSISLTAVCPGSTINIQTLWSPATQPQRNYSTYIHLSNTQQGEINLSPDQSLGTQRRPTTTWVYPGEVIVNPQQVLTVPANVQPGLYNIWLGVYEPLGNQRLTLPDQSDHFVMGTLEVKLCRASF